MTRLVRIAGLSLLTMAGLSLTGQQLNPVRGDVQVVVFVGALAEVILGAGLLVLARYTAHRVTGAFLGIWLISALSLVHLAFETLIRIPGVSLQVTLPGQNVLNTATMNAILAVGRPAWWVPVTIAPALLCAACLTATLAVSASVAARSLRPAAGGDAAPSARPAAGSLSGTEVPGPSSATGTALEVRTAVDPWAGQGLTPQHPTRR